MQLASLNARHNRDSILIQAGWQAPGKNASHFWRLSKKMRNKNGSAAI